MSTVAIKITNLSEIKSAFSKSPAKMTEQLNIAIRKASLEIQSRSMINSPVLTGRLRASHTSLFSNLKGIVQPNTNYAFFVHDGTKYMKARPFLADAVKSEETKVNDYFKIAVQNTLDDIASSV